jgi:DNA-binding phage protein
MPKIASRSNSKPKLIAYDVAKQLRTPEEMAAYLDAWLIESPEDAAGIARGLGNVARAVRNQPVEILNGLGGASGRVRR